MNNHFTILIPSYNVENWAEKNITSAINQNYDNFDIVYIDDCSGDSTFEIAKGVFSGYKPKNSNCNVVLERNSFNKGKMHNVFEAVCASKDGTIVIILDGDDWLAHDNVLSYLNDVYNSGDVWMSNGSYVIEPSGEVVRPLVNENYWNGNIRKKSWEFSHLGTFKKELFCRIKRKDLMNHEGAFWSTTSDQAIMWPMVEMASDTHFRAINEVLYVYNRLNPLCDDMVNRYDQLLTERIIRNKKPYSRLGSL